MPWPPWAPWAPPRPRGSMRSIPPRDIATRRSTRMDSGAPEDPSVRLDAHDAAHILKTESIAATCLLIIAACALGFIVFFLRAILVPFAIAVFLMYLLQPMVNYLCKPPRRWCDKCVKRRGEICCEGCFRVTKSRTYSTVSVDERAGLELEHTHRAPEGWGCFNKPVIPRWIAVFLAIFLVLMAWGVVGVILYGSIQNLQANIDKYELGAERVASAMDRWLRKYDYSLDKDFMPWAVEKFRQQIPQFVKLTISFVQYFFLVVIFLVYLLISPVRPIKSSVWGMIDLHIRRYIRLKTMVGVLVAVVVTGMLWLLGIQLAYVFGIFTFVLHFIPNLGPLVATCLPMPLVVFDPDLPFIYQALAFLGPTMAHVAVGNFVEPGLFGESFELSPVVVLLSLAFWGSLWGIPGMILAVPMIVIARIVCDIHDHPYANTFVRLLAGNIYDARREDPVTTGWTGGNTADLSWGNERVDEELSTAETAAYRTSDATLQSTSVPAGLDEDPPKYGSTSGS